MHLLVGLGLSSDENSLEEDWSLEFIYILCTLIITFLTGEESSELKFSILKGEFGGVSALDRGSSEGASVISFWYNYSSLNSKGSLFIFKLDLLTVPSTLVLHAKSSRVLMKLGIFSYSGFTLFWLGYLYFNERGNRSERSAFCKERYGLTCKSFLFWKGEVVTCDT